MSNKLMVSYAPHIRDDESVRDTMLDVLIALIPAFIFIFWVFGIRGWMVVGVTVLSCVLSEYVWCRLLKKKNTVSDLSAVVTGVLLAFTLPSTIPLWMCAIGGIFAIIVAKQFFGGIGHNILNPALCARAFMLASWPVDMTSYIAPFMNPFSPDAVTSATPLAMSDGVTYYNLISGQIGGSIGEVSSILLIIGGLYLILRKKITPAIPLGFILSVGVFGFIFSKDGLFAGNPIFSVFSGGVILGAIFMATDYVTSPVTLKGQIIYSVLGGFITVIIRTYGGYPEGVTYAILLMNIATPLLDKYIQPRKYGYKRIRKAKEVR